MKAANFRVSTRPRHEYYVVAVKRIPTVSSRSLIVPKQRWAKRACTAARCARCPTGAGELPDDWYWYIVDTDIRLVCSGCLTAAENIAIADFDVVGMQAQQCDGSAPPNEPIQLPDFIRTAAGAIKPLEECTYDELASQPNALGRRVARSAATANAPSDSQP